MQVTKQPAKTIHSILCLIMIVLLSACATQHHGNKQSVYLESKTPMQDVQNALVKAANNDRLLLIVMGAQWCHDSRGLAENFAKSELASIITQHYELIYIDVGYYKDLREISSRFGQAHYFATPTVMVIDPVSETLLNAKDLAIWGSADSVPFNTYLEYFERYAKLDSVNLPKADANILAEHILTILDFESRQAERLQYAYGILVPDMIREDLSGQINDEFTKRWIAVRDYRMQLQKDILSLYQQAIDSPNAELLLPDYLPFDWEK
ncbi:thioredoxin family protein [Glaciecola sp. SC05]|uniref:thioredoxin family protein n=1 Tax=Glaciecola sp. SC05 TaxID=1987355 RepID=UPI00352830E2